MTNTRIDTELPGVYVVQSVTYATGWAGMVEVRDELRDTSIIIGWNASAENGGPYDADDAIAEAVDIITKARAVPERDPDEWHDARFDREDA